MGSTTFMRLLNMNSCKKQAKVMSRPWEKNVTDERTDGQSYRQMEGHMDEWTELNSKELMVKPKVFSLWWVGKLIQPSTTFCLYFDHKELS